MRSTEKTGRKNVSPGWLRTCEVGATLGAPPRENHGDRRDKAAQIFRARQGVKAKAYWRYVEPQTTRHCAKRQAVLARRPPRFSRPRQEPEVFARCSIVALRPVGRIARFAPHLQVAVSAIGRAPFRCLPLSTQNHAALPARPRSARTLRDSFVRCGAWVRGLR